MSNFILFISYFGKTKPLSNQELNIFLSINYGPFQKHQNHVTPHLILGMRDHIISPLIEYSQCGSNPVLV